MNDPSKSKEAAPPDHPLFPVPGRGAATNVARGDQPPDGHNKAREPFFGHGAGPLLGELIVSVGALGLLLIVLLLAASVKEKASRLLYGGPQHYSRPQ